MIKDVLRVDVRALNAKKISSTQRVCRWKNIIFYANKNVILEVKW